MVIYACRKISSYILNSSNSSEWSAREVIHNSMTPSPSPQTRKVFMLLLDVILFVQWYINTLLNEITVSLLIPQSYFIISIIYCQSIDHQCHWHIHNSVLISRPRIYLHDPTSWCSGIDINPCRCWPRFKLVNNCFTRTPWRPNRSITVLLGHLCRLVSVSIVTVSSLLRMSYISGLKFKF